jgi:hypothetical protein
VLRLTPDGRQVRRGAAPLPVSPRAAAWLDAGLAQRLLDSLDRQRLVSQLLQHDTPADHPRVLRHLMWLLKQGLVHTPFPTVAPRT